MTAQNRAESVLDPGTGRRSRSDGNHPPGVASDVHEVIRIIPRRGCAWLEILCLIGCFLLIGVLILMHIQFVGDSPGENGCLPIRNITESKPELIEIRIIGSFSRLASRLRSELSLAIQKRTDVVTIVLNNDESKQPFKNGHGRPSNYKSDQKIDEPEPLKTDQSHPSRGRAGPLAALVKRTVAEPWKRVIASVRRVRSSMALGQEDSEAEQSAVLDPDDHIHSETGNPEPNAQDSFFYLPLRMSSSFTASKVIFLVYASPHKFSEILYLGANKILLCTECGGRCCCSRR